MGERCGCRIYAGDGEESSWQTSFCKVLRKLVIWAEDSGEVKSADYNLDKVHL